MRQCPRGSHHGQGRRLPGVTSLSSQGCAGGFTCGHPKGGSKLSSFYQGHFRPRGLDSLPKVTGRKKVAQKAAVV